MTMKKPILAGTLSAVAIAAVAMPMSASAGSSPAPPASAAQSQNIVEIASGDKRFDTLVRLVKKAGLVETLSGGEFTVFAPTDKAFKKVPKKTLKALAKNKKKLTAVLTYHAVAGTVKAADVVKLDRAKTVNGKNVRIDVRGGKVFLDRNSRVTQTDIEASNGVVHVINRVLIP
jgi:uncharacterized surface protein with fasciclin (FAS1) repeats